MSHVSLYVIGAYLVLLLGLGLVSGRFFRGTSADYFVASRSIGPFMLLMSVFGTTMTAFALVGSSGEAYTKGIGVYGFMASWSGLIHSAVFFLVGIRLWAIGKKHGYVTQCQFFRERFESPLLSSLLFPLLVFLIIPYLLVGLLGAGAVMQGSTKGMFPEVFADSHGGIPPWLTGLVICSVVLTYVFFGGVRSTVWANTFQTLVFMTTGVIAFVMIAKAFGGANAATAMALEHSPQHLAREGMITKMQFATYCFIPLSVGMFPHIFQHWLTARSARTFRLTVVMHPICIAIVWLPCILIGTWAAGSPEITLPAAEANAVLGVTLGLLAQSPLLSGLLTAGILAAIMSSLDSQFMCLSTMFTHDVLLRLVGERTVSDRQKLLAGRAFVIFVVIVTYLWSLAEPRSVFSMGVWCFSGFSGLFPLVLAAVYWKRATRAGALSCVLVTGAVWLTLFARADFGKASEHDTLLFGMMPVAVILASSALTMLIVSLLTRPPAPSIVEQFIPSVGDGSITAS
jgi:SSS family solute:Na+ symporter